MAQFSYAQYAAQRAAQTTTNNNGNPNVHFVNEFLKDDGSEIVVRFPYRSMDDVFYVPTHVVNWPNAPFGKRVACTGDASCPLCAQANKVDMRFLAKCLVYTINPQTNSVIINNCVWDRPAAFADIDLKNLLTEYGDLSQQLFKIKRNGSGKNTRYTTSIIVNNIVYNPEVYRPDFSELEQIDVEKICVKSYQQYLDVNKAPATAAAPATSTMPAAPVAAPQVYQNYATTPVANNYMEAPVPTAINNVQQPQEQQYVAPQSPTYNTQPPVYNQPTNYQNAAPTADPNLRQPKKYTF